MIKNLFVKIAINRLAKENDNINGPTLAIACAFMKGVGGCYNAVTICKERVR